MKDLVNEKMNEFVLFGHRYLLKFITNGLKHFQRLRSWRTDKPPGWRTEEWTKKLLVARNQLVNKWYHTVKGTPFPACSNQVKKWNESGAARRPSAFYRTSAFHFHPSFRVTAQKGGKELKKKSSCIPQVTNLARGKGNREKWKTHISH